MAGTSLLTLDDPLLPRVRDAAVQHPTALAWLLDSARAWARREFVRRQESHERALGDQFDMRTVGKPYLDERLEVLVRHQVAVLAAQGKRERTYVGFLCEGSHSTFLQLSISRGVEPDISGVFDVQDIFELPPEWRVSAWPTDKPRVIDRQRPSIMGELNDKRVVIDPNVMREIDSMGPAFQEQIAASLAYRWSSSSRVIAPGMAMTYKGIPIITMDAMTPDAVMAMTPSAFTARTAATRPSTCSATPTPRWTTGPPG